jgi:hypothetical protein
MDVCLLKVLCVVQVEVYVSGRSLVQSPTECGVSERDRGTSTIRRPWPTKGCRGLKKNIYKYIYIYMYVAVLRAGMKYKYKS